jgi:hypothetical protein
VDKLASSPRQSAHTAQATASEMRISDERYAMPDKSPQRPAGKKSGKTLKEKRADKQLKQQTKRSLSS